MKHLAPLAALLALAPAHAQDETLPKGALARLGSKRLHHKDEVLSLAFSPDSKRLASTSHDGTLRTWDAATGAPLATHALRQRDETIAWITTTRVCLLAESLERPARIVDLKTGEEAKTISLEIPAAERATALAIDHAGAVVALATRDGHVTLLRDGVQVANPEVGLVHQLVVSPDGSRVAAATYAGVIVLSAKDGSVAQNVAADRLLRCAFSPDGKALALVRRGTSGVALAGTEKVLEDRDAHPLCVAFSPDGMAVATGDSDGTIRIFDVKTCEQRPLPRHRGRITAVGVSRDGATIVTAEHERTLHFWRGDEHQELAVPSGVRAMAFAPTGSLGVACGDGTMKLLDPARGAELAVSEPSRSALDAIAFASSGTRSVTATGSSSGRIHYREDGQRKAEDAVLDFGVTSLAVAGGRVFAGCMDKVVRVFEWGGAVPVGRLEGHERMIESVAASPDGQLVATVSAERVARIFSARTFAREATLEPKGATAIAFSPDSRRLAVGYADGTVRVVDSVTASEKKVLTGHDAGVTALAWSQDGKRLVSGSRDFTALVWDLSR